MILGTMGEKTNVSFRRTEFVVKLVMFWLLKSNMIRLCSNDVSEEKAVSEELKNNHPKFGDSQKSYSELIVP